MQGRKRLALVDVFRLICVCFIGLFHTWAFFIGSNSSEGQPYFLYNVLEITNAFYFDRAGIWIATISFFLFGYLDSKLQVWRLGLFAVGAMALQYVGANDWDFLALQNYSWGVFSYIFTGYLILLFTCKLSQPARTGVHLCLAALLFIPHSLYRDWLSFLSSGILKQALIGDFLNPEWPTGWFLLPWLGLIMLSFEVGTWLRLRRNLFSQWISIFDWALMAVVIASFVSFLIRGPEFFGGSLFNRGIFWVEPLDLAFTVIFPMWIFRLAQIEKVQAALSRSRISQRISSLCWNQHFWFCYMLHVCLLYLLLITLPEDFAKQPLVLQLIGPFVLVFVELYGTSFFKRRAALKSTQLAKPKLGLSGRG